MERFDPPRRALAVWLAAVAGFVDAIGYLLADRYFVSFMSGNTTRMGVELVAGPGSAAEPALLILGFVAGVVLGSVVAERAGRWRKPAVLGLVAALLVTAATAGDLGARTAMLAALVLAMGAINNTLHDGASPLGVTYMTGALVRFGQGLGGWLSGSRERGWLLYGLLWLGLAGGALAGALALHMIGSGALWIAVAALAGLALYAWSLARG